MRLLLGIDGSQSATHMLVWASQTLNPNKAHLELLYVINAVSDTFDVEHEIKAANRTLSETRTQLEERGFRVDKTQYVMGDPTREICRYADKHDIDHVLLGSHGHSGIKKLALGSVSEEVLEHCRKPVFIYRAGHDSMDNKTSDTTLTKRNTAMMNVLIPVDNSECSVKALQWAGAHFDPKATRFHLLYVYKAFPDMMANVVDDDFDAMLAKARQLVERAGGTVEKTSYVIGDPVHQICEYADTHDMDLVVVGSHGTGGLAKVLLGSVSEGVLEHCKKPVFVIRAFGITAKGERHFNLEPHLMQGKSIL